MQDNADCRTEGEDNLRMKNRNRITLLKKASVLAFVFAFAVLAQAGNAFGADNNSKNPNNKFQSIHIKNFGQMDEHIYRGAQPDEEDYKDLAALGVKTVVDLRDDPTSYEKPMVESLGMRYINIPMSDKKRPTDEEINRFLEIANDSASGPLYIHCAGGRHRTGVMGAVYRFNHYGWNFDQVYKEMKDYDYYSRWGHGALKDYVKDYYDRIQEGQIVVSTGEAASATSR